MSEVLHERNFFLNDFLQKSKSQIGKSWDERNNILARNRLDTVIINNSGRSKMCALIREESVVMLKGDGWFVRLEYWLLFCEEILGSLNYLCCIVILFTITTQSIYTNYHDLVTVQR